MEEKLQQELVDISSLGLSDDELFSHYEVDPSSVEKITAPRYSYWKAVFRQFFKKKINWICLGLLLVVILMAFIYPIFQPYNMTENISIITEAQHLRTAAAFQKFGPSIKWLLGTGAQGQSIWNAIWSGARHSILLSFICAIINMIIGVLIGAIWGFNRRVDALMNEIYNLIANVPFFLLIGVFVRYLPSDPSRPSDMFWKLVLALTITGWMGIAYTIRTQVLIIRDREYNLASRCLGTPLHRVIFKNILPFMISIIVTILATELPAYIGTEASLIYFGFATTTDSLGFLISEAEPRMLIAGQRIEFWGPVLVTIIISIVLLLVGQNLGDASDPKTHR